MDKIKIGYDDNLGLPSDFAETIGCEIVSYHDLSKMIAAFEAKELSAMFIPAGTFPYLNNYEVIAQSLFGASHQMKLRTNFVSTKEISVSEIPKLTIGRVNQYCTTSFWAPLIYLMSHLPQNTSLTFKNTNSFPDMLHKTAEKIVDCCMIWDIIMQENPNDADKVKLFFFKDDLPSPVIIKRSGEENGLKDKLTQFISQDQKAFFRGFTTPDMASITEFITAMKNAEKYFKLTIE